MAAQIIAFPQERCFKPQALELARASARTLVFESLRQRDPLAARIGRSLERFLARISIVDEPAQIMIELHMEALCELEAHRSCDMEIQSDIVDGVERLSAGNSAA